MPVLVRSHNRLLLSAFFAVCAGICVLLIFFDPVKVGWLPFCAFHKLTGLDCPGCGSMRGLHALMHGRLLAAADHNLLLSPALLMLASGFYYKLTGNGARLWMWLNRPKIILVVVAAFWILRNIPAYPFSWLASGAGVSSL